MSTEDESDEATRFHEHHRRCGDDGAVAPPAWAEPVRRIGVLTGMDAGDPAGQSEVTALKQGLQELGWVEGRNLQIEYYWPGGEPDRIQASAKELVARGSDVIVARTTPVVAALLKETRIIPIIFTYVFDPIGSGFVRNFAQPGGNVTGFQTFEPTIVGKWLQILLEIAPSVRRIGFIYNPRTIPPDFCARSRRLLPRLQSGWSQRLFMTPRRSMLLSPHSQEQPGEGLIIVADAFTDANHALIVALAARYRLPAIYPHRFDDALITYGPDLTDLLRRAASYVDRILRGEKPSELPVQAPTKYELIINLKAAKALGLEVPGHLQQLADEVIE